jgi:hypothetical protein
LEGTRCVDPVDLGTVRQRRRDSQVPSQLQQGGRAATVGTATFDRDLLPREGATAVLFLKPATGILIDASTVNVCVRACTDRPIAYTPSGILGPKPLSVG